MAEKKDTIENWERNRGVVINGSVELKKSVTLEEFEDLASKKGYVGVAFGDRERFLQDNGHEVTRNNLTDSTLSTKQPDQEEA